MSGATSQDIAPASPNIALDIAGCLRSAKTAVKTCVVILAVIGAAHVTEPLRADAAPAAVVKTVKGASSGKG